MSSNFQTGGKFADPLFSARTVVWKPFGVFIAQPKYYKYTDFEWLSIPHRAPGWTQQPPAGKRPLRTRPPANSEWKRVGLACPRSEPQFRRLRLWNQHQIRGLIFLSAKTRQKTSKYGGCERIVGLRPEMGPLVEYVDKFLKH